ncbi:hypothetical protein FNV43_RR08484 [Rhamnella rubrinervis]|uniref:Uncharacterized protein n=1 Tax=Rhamnella rubrinervis TaxID=2594499 RepID=A0A8K0H9C1_9ROSA|nr:hypothetical protein FNV43_RR08484 [Rhamnella rubrinervis]
MKLLKLRKFKLFIEICIGRIPTEQGREAEDGGMSGATVVGEKKSSETSEASLEVLEAKSECIWRLRQGRARLRGGAIITWLGEGLARTSRPGGG